MKEKKIEVLVLEDGRIVIENLPVRAGQQVEVIVRIEESAEPGWPLRGLPVTLKDPFLPAIPESEWEAGR